jgi:flagellar assembly protein FliH
MSDALPKEQQTAYQRWEMASFDTDRTPARSNETIAQIAAENEILREQARQQGHAEGLAQGYTVGMAQGRAESAQETQHLQQLAVAFGTEISRANEVIANDMLELGLDLAKGMLKTALTIRPELVLPVVAEAIRYLPSLQQPAQLFLHPADAKLAREFIGEELSKAGWQVSEDIQLVRGGCRVETPANQIDGSMETRWQRIAAALGKDNAWLDQ